MTKNKKILNMSKFGYRDDSPYNHLPYIDIHSNNGIIDMSATGQPLMANGRYLPPYSGQHQFNTNVIRETPIFQKGGSKQHGLKMVNDTPEEILRNDMYNTYKPSQDVYLAKDPFLYEKSFYNAILNNKKGLLNNYISTMNDDYGYNVNQAIFDAQLQTGIYKKPFNYNPLQINKMNTFNNTGLTYKEGGTMPDRYKALGFSSINTPKKTPNAAKSHAVVIKENGNYELIRFGQQGVTGSPKKDGESENNKERREAFQARHAANIAKGKSSAAYWSNKIKWQNGGEIPNEFLQVPSMKDYMDTPLGKGIYDTYSGPLILDKNGKEIKNFTRRDTLKTMANYMKYNASNQSSEPSNVYRPEFQHLAVNEDTFMPDIIPYAKKGGYINKAGRYVHKDGVTTSKPGLWSNVYMKNKKELGGIITPKYQLGTNNFVPVGSTIFPGSNTTNDKAMCPPGFAFVGGKCLPLQSDPEANIGGGSNILPTAKTDYVTQQYKTDAAFAKRYDDSINNYTTTQINKNTYNPFQDIKLGMLGVNAIAGIAGTMYDNNYKLKNARKIQADNEYNPSFSYGANDYGVAKKGGFLQHLAEGGDVNGNEFDAYDFLFNDEDDNKAEDAIRTTTEDIAAATAKADEYAAIAKENEELKMQAQEQQDNDLAMGIANEQGWYAKNGNKISANDEDNNESNINYSTSIATTPSKTMNDVKSYYQSKGYEPEFIAGVLGNIHAESNGRSNINEGNGGGGYGLFQHTGARRTQLVNFAKSRNMSPADPIAQAMFAEQEPDFQNAHRAFQSSPDKSPGKAAVIFEQKFERAGIKRYGTRIGAANSIYQSFQSGGEYDVSDVELQDLIRQGIQFQMM